MSIPRIRMTDLALRHGRVAERVEFLVAEVLRSGRYIGGPAVAEAEAALARRLGRRFGVGVNCGTDGLTLSLLALGVRPGDEVIVPAVSFFATAEAVLRCGAVPVVVDVLADRPLIDPEATASAITPRTRAIIPVHLFGLDAGLPDLGLPVVDDAAQAVGARPPRGRGVLAAVSFYPTKVLGGAGDGGMVFSDDAELALRVRSLGSHGMGELHVHHLVAGNPGCNSRLDAVQAAVLLGHLPDLDARIERRRAIADSYLRELGDLAMPHDAGSPISVFVVRHPERDALAAALAHAAVDTTVYYPRPLSAQPALAGAVLHATPNAERFCAEALALPCHVGMSDDDVGRVVAAVRRQVRAA